MYANRNINYVCYVYSVFASTCSLSKQHFHRASDAATANPCAWALAENVNVEAHKTLEVDFAKIPNARIPVLSHRAASATMTLNKSNYSGVGYSLKHVAKCKIEGLYVSILGDIKIWEKNKYYCNVFYKIIFNIQNAIRTNLRAVFYITILYIYVQLL